MTHQFNLIVKWSGTEYFINDENLTLKSTILDLKQEIFKKTSVLPERQKLIGFKLKNMSITDDTKLEDLNLNENFKIMMVGTQEKDINVLNSEELKAESFKVVNDFDTINDIEVEVINNKENLAKIAKRVKEYNFQILNPPREGKKLLVLDIDYTLFDHKSVAENINQLKRPYLHEFLKESYKEYDIIIWSATEMKWIEVKMRELGLAQNPDFKIICYLDYLAMISVQSNFYGVLNIKPLQVIWGKFNQYSAKNTIMFDDVRRNFLMNPQSGLKIKPFREARKNQAKDKELFYLTEYLKFISELDDFTILNHKHWLKYIEKYI